MLKGTQANATPVALGCCTRTRPGPYPDQDPSFPAGTRRREKPEWMNKKNAGFTGFLEPI